MPVEFRTARLNLAIGRGRGRGLNPVGGGLTIKAVEIWFGLNPSRMERLAITVLVVDFNPVENWVSNC